MNEKILEKIHRQKALLQKARNAVDNITDKYSINYKQWVKACNKINNIRKTLNTLIRQYNYDTGFGYNIVYLEK